MPAPAVTVELGYLGPPPPPGAPADVRARLVYLPLTAAVVIPESWLEPGWNCRIIARRRSDNTVEPSHVRVGNDEFAAAATTITLDEGDADGFAMLWSVRVRQRWPHGHMPHLARLIATNPARAGTVVDLHADVVRRLIIGAHLRPPALRRLLARLVDAELLTTLRPGLDGSWGSYTLTLPLSARQPPTATIIEAASMRPTPEHSRAHPTRHAVPGRGYATMDASSRLEQPFSDEAAR